LATIGPTGSKKIIINNIIILTSFEVGPNRYLPFNSGDGCGGWNGGNVEEKSKVLSKMLKIPDKWDMCGKGDKVFGETGDHGEKW
jgi:hypothetical protein